MQEILSKDFKNLVDYKAVVINDKSVLVYNNSPLVLFKKILNQFEAQILKVFFFDNLVYVDIDLPESLGLYSLLEAKYCTISHDKVIRVYQWLSWFRSVKFCNKCGYRLSHVESLMQKQCLSCRELFFPNLAPAVIVLIKKKNKILLARSPHFPKGVFSLVAGFIDAGESAEDAVKREVYEEVGVNIKNIKYFASQSWPYGGSFMLAYVADFASGEIKIDNNEIEKAGWFSLDQLPMIPTSSSIASNLIKHVVF